MGMPIAKDRVWTLEEVWALPDDPQHRYELVDGELLVSPSPRPLHQRAVLQLQLVLHPYARDTGMCEVLAAPSDVVIQLSHLVQPDVYVIRRLSQVQLRADPRTLPLPLLAIEVLSPSTARADRLTKRRLYQRAGIELWIVDLDARLIERWTPEADRPEISAEWIEWCPSGASALFRLDVDALMRRILDD
jgi:Uma2 family endonuclease